MYDQGQDSGDLRAKPNRAASSLRGTDLRGHLLLSNRSSMLLNASAASGTLGSGPSGMRSSQRPCVSPAVGGSRNRPRASYLANPRPRVAKLGKGDILRLRQQAAEPNASTVSCLGKDTYDCGFHAW